MITPDTAAATNANNSSIETPRDASAREAADTLAASRWLLGSVLLAAVFGRVALANLNRGVVGGDIDGYENMWNNYWVKTALFDLHRSIYYSDYIYYPLGVSLRFHTLNPLNGLITLPFNLSLGYIPSINLLFVLAPALSAWFAFLFLRDLVGNPWAAFAGASLFAYADSHPPIFFISGQTEKISMEWLPLYFFFLFRALYGRPVWARSSTFLMRETGRWAVYAVGAVAALVFMALTDWQYVMHSVFATVLFALFVLFTKRTRGDKARIWGKLAAVGGAFALVVGPTLLLPMLQEALNSIWLRVGQNSQARALDLLDLIGPGLGNPGYLALAAAILGLVAAYRRGGLERETGLFWGILAALFYIVALGPNLVVGGKDTGIPLPYAIWQYSPVFSIGRDPGRFSTTAVLGVGVLAAFGLCALFRRLRSERGATVVGRAEVPGIPKRGWVPGLLALIFVAVSVSGFLLAAGDAKADTPDWPAFYKQIAADPPDYSILELPMFTDAGRGEDHYMMYQVLHNKPRFGGRWARDHKLSNPTNIVRRSGLFRNFWLAAASPGERTPFFPKSDFLARTDYSVYGLPVLNYYKVRYIVLYKEAIAPADMPKFTGAVEQVLGKGAKPSYSDSLMLVYTVPTATTVPSDPLTLDVGENWYPSAPGENNTVYRWANTEGDVHPELSSTNISPNPVHATLSFTAYTYKTARTLQVALNGQQVASFTLKPEEGAQPYEVPLLLPSGNNEILFTTPEPPLPTGDPHDSRLLSFGMYGVKLTPQAAP